MAGGRPAATRDAILLAVRAFVTREGRLPQTADLGKEHGMPGHSVVYTLFGSMHGLYMAYEAWRARQGYGVVPCLGCDRLWVSPDRRRNRLCPACRHQRPDTGDWMTGSPVPEGGIDLVEDDDMW